MKKLLAFTVLLGSLGFGLAACASDSDRGCQTCAAVTQSGTGWCEACDHGLVGGRDVACRGCYDAQCSGGSCPAHH